MVIQRNIQAYLWSLTMVKDNIIGMPNYVIGRVDIYYIGNIFILAPVEQSRIFAT